jgi:hypothetical protein
MKPGNFVSYISIRAANISPVSKVTCDVISKVSSVFRYEGKDTYHKHFIG